MQGKRRPARTEQERQMDRRRRGEEGTRERERERGNMRVTMIIMHMHRMSHVTCNMQHGMHEHNTTLHK